MNKKWNCFFTLALLFGLILSGPKQLIFAETSVKADLIPDTDSTGLYTGGSGIGTLTINPESLETPDISLFISTPTYYGRPFNLRAIALSEANQALAGTVDFSIDGEPVAVCQDVVQDEMGQYFCQNVTLPVAVGDHTLSASFTPADSGTYNTASDSIPFTVDSGSYLISGIVFNDANKDGEMVSPEYGISSWTVNLSTCNGDPVMGTNGSVIGPQVTGYFGLFTFTNVPGGQCVRVTQENQTGWQATSPTQLEFTLSQDLHLVYFGNYYPTIIVNTENNPLPEGKVGKNYEQQLFTATGGEGPYLFTIEFGALPDGMEMSLDGILSGTPTLAGDYFFSVQAEDQNKAVGHQYYMVTVSEEITFAVFLPLVGN